MKNPEVSIIIPCFNNGIYLKEMIHCFQHQTFPNWELIIVDDKSSDNTPIIVKEFEKKDNRIKLLIRDREPKGSVVCRNIGSEISQGKYIMHLDADDLISDTCLENRVKFMKANPKIDYASFPAMTFTNSKKLPIFSHKGRQYGVGSDNTDLLQKFLKANYPFSTWNNIYKRDSIINIPWDETVKIYTDFSFIVPGILRELKHTFSGTREIDYYYRAASSTAMTSNFVSPEKCQSTIYLFSKTLSFLENRIDYEKRKQEFSHFIILHFERLLLSDQKENIEEYIAFCKQHFSKFLIMRMNLITKLNYIPIKKRNIKTVIIYTELYLLFWHKRYFKTIGRIILTNVKLLFSF
jgi:glycosyltransferase involved in cell wall biosynthesis